MPQSWVDEVEGMKGQERKREDTENGYGDGPDVPQSWMEEMDGLRGSKDVDQHFSPNTSLEEAGLGGSGYDDADPECTPNDLNPPTSTTISSNQTSSSHVIEKENRSEMVKKGNEYKSPPEQKSVSFYSESSSSRNKSPFRANSMKQKHSKPLSLSHTSM